MKKNKDLITGTCRNAVRVLQVSDDSYLTILPHKHINDFTTLMRT